MDPISLVTGMNAAVAFGILAAVQGLKGLAPQFFATTRGQRLLPLIPMALGVGAFFAGAGEMLGPDTPANKVFMGLLVGFSSMAMFKIGKTTMLGKGLTSAEDMAAEEAKEHPQQLELPLPPTPPNPEA